MRFVVNPGITALSKRISDPSKALDQYSRDREKAFKRQILLGIDPYGSKYRGLSPRYARAKRQQWGDRPILVASGEMVRSHKVMVRGGKVQESLKSPAPAHATGDRSLPKRAPLPDNRGLPESDRDLLWNAVVRNARGGFY